MKRSCKNIDVTNPEIIKPFIKECIYRHYKRHDFRELLLKYGLKKDDYYEAIKIGSKELYNPTIDIIAKDISNKIAINDIDFDAPKIRVRQDRSNGKVRMIGMESAYQQLYDYIAVRACNEIWARRMVLQQFSSIKGRGQIIGVKTIKGYIESDNRTASYAKTHKLRYIRKCKYFAKLDISKCYPSANKKIFIELFKKDLGNSKILNIWESILESYGRSINIDDAKAAPYTGFLIGALPSQWAAQYLISFIYRYAMEIKAGRRGTYCQVINHMALFMDDMLILGSNRKNLKSAIRQIIKFAKEKLGFKIKPNWHISSIDMNSIDMMGYVIHANGKVTIRGRNFIKSRRMILRYHRRGSLNFKQAKRLTSYKGFYKYSNSAKVQEDLNTSEAFTAAAKVVSRYAKGEQK